MDPLSDLRDELEGTDNAYVKPTHLESFEDPRQAGKALRSAEERGWVSQWSDSNHDPTYRVLV